MIANHTRCRQHKCVRQPVNSNRIDKPVSTPQQQSTTRSNMIPIKPRLSNSYSHTGNSAAFVARHARSLFRASVWQQVGSLLAANAQNTNECFESFTALQYTNYNLVNAAPHDSAALVSVVMVNVNIGSPSRPYPNWSDQGIDDIIQRGVKYGEIKKDTHIIVQLFFKGMLERNWPVDEAVAVVLMSAKGLAYTYNVPGGICEQLTRRIVYRLLFVTTASFPSGVLRVINYKPRTPSDDNLYALFLTASTATESRKQAFSDVQNGPDIGAVDISTCRPPTRCCRPTRVIGNLRFLMLLCNPVCEQVGNELMLDETNSLDAFRRVAKIVLNGTPQTKM
jgi:hypothetical protein